MSSDFDAVSQKLGEQITVLQDQLKTVGHEYFKDATKALFDTYPGLEWFDWRQYTPYFNDGDACVFGVDAYGNAFLNGEELEEVYFSQWRQDEKAENGEELTEEEKFARDYYTLLTKVPEDVMESLFGDHVKITVNRDGRIEVDEYNHD